MTASIISAAAMVIVAIIEAVAARDRKRDKQERAQMQERQELQEQLMLELIKGNSRCTLQWGYACSARLRFAGQTRAERVFNQARHSRYSWQ